MNLRTYFADLLTFHGCLSGKHYAGLMAPISFFNGAVFLVGFVIAGVISPEIGGRIMLAAIFFGVVATIPISVRRARDIGWITIFPPALSLVALLSIAAFMSLLLPISLGIWSMLEKTGFGLFWWGLVFATCLGLWAWCCNSLLDRPSKDAKENVEAEAQSASEEGPRAALGWLLAFLRRTGLALVVLLAFIPVMFLGVVIADSFPSFGWILVLIPPAFVIVGVHVRNKLEAGGSAAGGRAREGR
jgi:hypothetical protein